MRSSLVILLTVAGAIVHATVSAQGTPGSGSGVDFSGIYAPPVFVATIAVVEPDEYPFTAAGKRSFDAYDPLLDAPNQADDCTADLMPWILWSNSPMELQQEHDRVVMRYERGNTIRSVPLNGPPPPPDQPNTEEGYSVARWDGNTLEIQTSHMLADVIRNNRGYPLSREARVTERYSREPGSNDLRMDFLVDDPVNYTETFTISRQWVWAPDEEVQDYGCVSLGPRDQAPDIDELVRMLEDL